MREQNSRTFISTAKAKLPIYDWRHFEYTHTDAITYSCKFVCIFIMHYVMQMHTDRRCTCSLLHSDERVPSTPQFCFLIPESRFQLAVMFLSLPSFLRTDTNLSNLMWTGSGRSCKQRLQIRFVHICSRTMQYGFLWLAEIFLQEMHVAVMVWSCLPHFSIIHFSVRITPGF